MSEDTAFVTNQNDVQQSICGVTHNGDAHTTSNPVNTITSHISCTADLSYIFGWVFILSSQSRL